MSFLREIERKWQELWERDRIFEADPKKQKKFYITIPYPYTSGGMHVGHGRTYTLGDIIARFYRMLGYNVLFPMAAHVSGTPISSISARIARGDEETIELYKDAVSIYERDGKKVEEIVMGFKDPERIANYFGDKVKEDLSTLGCSIDWRRFFKTNEPYYNKFVEWQFKKLNSLGFIKKGNYPILYCLRCENAVGEDDIKGGDEIKAGILQLQLIKFPYGDAFLVASTLRAETIFGATNLWINPRDRLVKISIQGEKWIISKRTLTKLRLQGMNFEVLEEMDGTRLIGERVKNPINSNELLILPASFVDPDFGTGVVYSVPSHAPYDYIALKDLQRVGAAEFGISQAELDSIQPISLITTPGYGEHPAIEICERLQIKDQSDREKLDQATQLLYKEEFYQGILKPNCMQFSGMKVSEAKEEVFQYLKQRGFASTLYEVTALERPVRCRCGGEVSVAIIPDQWFLDYGNEKWKSLARKCLEQIQIFPQEFKKVFMDTIDWLHERPCTRKRGLGTRFPFDRRWLIESLSDSTIYMAFYTIVHWLRKLNISAERLDEAFFDYVFLEQGDPVEIAERLETDVAHLKKMAEEFRYWYPLDLRSTGTAHLQNHLTFFIFHHAAIFPEKYWPRAINLNGMVISEGRKMSKSFGNIVPIQRVASQYSVDAYRLYISYAADPITTLDFRVKELESFVQKVEKFYYLIKNSKPSRFRKRIVIRSFLSKFYRNLRSALEKMKNYEIRDYIQSVFFNVSSDLASLRNKISEEEFNGVVNYISKDWLKFLAPIIPHVCEELWHSLGENTYISLEKLPKIKEKLIDEQMEKLDEFIEKLSEDLMTAMRLSKIERPKVAHIILAAEWKYKFYETAIQRAKIGEVNWNELIQEFGENSKSLIKKFLESKLDEVIPRKLELKALREAKVILERNTGIKIRISVEEESKIPKAKEALPFRPSIFIE